MHSLGLGILHHLNLCKTGPLSGNEVECAQVKLLLECKARVNKVCTGRRRSALHYAAIGSAAADLMLGEACGRHVEVMKLLLDSKAQVLCRRCSRVGA